MRLYRRVLATSLAYGVSVLEQARNNLDGWLKRVRLDGEPSAVGERGKTGQPEGYAVPGSPTDCLQAIIDGLDDEVMIITPDFRIRQANNALRRRLGPQATHVVGQPCFQISRGAEEPCSSPWCECPLKRVLETGETVRVVHARRESQADDGERWVEIVAAPVRDSGGNITEVIELARDVSESKKLQKDILRANRELLALNFIGRALSQSLDLNSTLQAVAETMLDALEAQVSWVRLLDDKIPVVRASRGLSAKALDELIEAVSSTVPGEQIATSASYSVVPGNGADRSAQTLWQFAVTPLKSKGVVLGTAGVATAKRPVDQQRIQLLDAIGSQIAVAIERCKLYEEIQLARDLRGELLHSIITTQEEERRRIARELHDETGQALTALRLCLERLALAPASSMEEVKAQLAQPLSLCQQAEDEVDKLIFDLRPALIDDLGLVEAIKSHAAARLGAAGIGVGFRITGEEKRLTSEKEVALFRVIQEGINNIIKHAGASSVLIRLHFRQNQLVAGIEDDGCGFEVTQPVTPQNARHGLGLLGMRERMSLIGGSLSIASRPGAGTRLKVVVPLAEEKVRA